MHRAQWAPGGIAAIGVLFVVSVSSGQPPATGESPQAPAPPPATMQPPSAPAQPAPVTPGPAIPEGSVPPPTTQAEPVPLESAEPVTEAHRISEDPLAIGAPTLLGPSVLVGPDLFNPPAPQGWLSITPTFTLSGEYNDNISFDSTGRKSDFSIGLIPGMTVSVQRPRYRLLAGYNVPGEFSTRASEFSDFGSRQQFFANGSYTVSPALQFTLSDQFVKDRDSSSVTTSGESTGRQNTWRNTLIPRLRWQATPSTAWELVAAYSVLRFDDSGDGRSTGGVDSDTYRLGVGVDHRLTPRLTGSVDVRGAYFSFEDEPSTRTYTLRPGLGYDVTPTLRAVVSAGPTVVDHADEQKLRPAVSALLVQLFQFGSLRVGYNRFVAAETRGVGDRQTVFAALIVPTLLRGLQFSVTPRYTRIDRGLTSDDETETNILTMNLRATYQIARSISLIGSYTFRYQTEDHREDLDQNRVFLGVQYAFPINFY